MRLFSMILGVVFLGIGVYTTYQAWSFAARGHLVGALGYVGPFLFVMGIYRIISAGASQRNMMLRYIALAIAIAAGFGNREAIKSAYPQATPLVTHSNQ